MSKSLIQTVNQSSQTVASNSIIDLGSVIRRFGCNCRLNGNAIEVEGAGYYKVDMNITQNDIAEQTADIDERVNEHLHEILDEIHQHLEE